MAEAITRSVSPGAVVITGGTKGIGLATARRFAATGHPIVVSYRRDDESARAARDELSRMDVDVTIVHCDLSEDASPLIDAVDALPGDVSTLVLNAAASAFKPLAEIRSHHIGKTVGLTIDSTIELVSRLSSRIAVHGSIVTVSGGDSIRFIPGHGLLGAMKSALETLTRYLSVELAPQGIRANCVLPGPVATDSARIWAGAEYDDFIERAAEATPLGRVAVPEDIAGVIHLLASPDAAWINGQVIVADGGLFFADAVFGRAS